MPAVRSIEILPDGWRVVTTRGGTHTITSDDIPVALRNRPLPQVEARANTFLANRLSPLGMFAAVHLTSVVPLKGDLVVSNEPLVGEWWVT